MGPKMRCRLQYPKCLLCWGKPFARNKPVVDFQGNVYTFHVVTRNLKWLMWLTLHFDWPARIFIADRKRFTKSLFCSLPSLQLLRLRLRPQSLRGQTIYCLVTTNMYCLMNSDTAGSDDLTNTSSFPTRVGRWKVLVLLLLSSSPSASLDPAHVAQSHLHAPCVMTVLRSPGWHQPASKQWRLLKPSSAVSRLSEDRSGLRHLTSEHRGGVTETHCPPLGRNLAKGLSEAMWKPLDLNRTGDGPCLPHHLK